MAHRRLAALPTVALLVMLWLGGAVAPASAAAPTPVPPGGTPQAEPRMPGALQLDGDRLCTWCAAALVRHHVSAVLRHRTGAIRAVVASYGWLDDTDRTLSPLDTLRDEPDPTGIPPFFIAKAARDANPGINDSIDRFVAEARARGVPVEYAVHEQGRHGFDTLNDDDRSREIVAQTLEFLHARLSPADAAAPESMPRTGGGGAGLPIVGIALIASGLFLAGWAWR